MVKGTKRKIEIKKIANRSSVATSFTKRSHGLYSKASQLCLLAGAQIAVLATPSSSQSNVSFYSFGHSSVNSVVSAFLARQNLPPVPEESKETREDLGICMARKDLGLGFWWDDDEKFKSPEEIKEAIESMKTLLSHVKALRSDLHKNPNQREEAFLNDSDGELPENQTGDEDHQIVSLSEDHLCNNNKNNTLSPNLDEWTDMDLDQLLKDCGDDVPDEEEPIVSFSENHLCNNKNNNTLSPNLDEWNDMDLDQLLKDCGDDVPDEEEPIVSLSEDHLCNNKNNNTLSPNLDEWNDMDLDQLLKAFGDDFPDEEEPIVSFSEETWNNNNNNLDFQTNLEANEFVESLLMI